MLRRVVTSSTTRMVSPTAVSSSNALSHTRRQISIADCTFWGGVANHFGQLIYPSTYLTGAALLYSPIGTLALVALAYNVVVIGGKHCWYTVELTAKDYLQDLQLYAVTRYLILLSILIGLEAVFIEV